MSTLSVKPSECVAILEQMIRSRSRVILWGPPGVGKSSIVHQVAKKLGRRVLELRAPTLEPIDVRGLPRIVGEQTKWVSPEFLPVVGRDNGGPGILFADEIAQSAPAVQAALLQGVLDHRVGEVDLDPEWVWVCASNRAEDRAGVGRVITPLLNRLIHIDMEPDVDDWLEWGRDCITPTVRAFIAWRRERLYDFDPNRNAKAFPTPRSWHMLSNALADSDHLPESVRYAIAAGAVGQGVAAEYIGFCQVYHSLPKIENILDNPKGHPVPDDSELSVLWALAASLVECLRGALKKPEKPRKKTIDAVGIYVQRLPLEIAAFALCDALQICPPIMQSPGMTQFLNDLLPYIK